MPSIRDEIERALKAYEGERGEDGVAARLVAAIDDLVQAARRVLDEPSEDATAALDAALSPWEVG